MSSHRSSSLVKTLAREEASVSDDATLSKSRCKITAFFAHTQQLSRIAKHFSKMLWFLRFLSRLFREQYSIHHQPYANTPYTNLHNLQFTDDRILLRIRGQNFKYINYLYIYFFVSNGSLRLANCQL